MFCELVLVFCIRTFAASAKSLAALTSDLASSIATLYTPHAASHGTGAVENYLRDLSALDPGALNRNAHYIVRVQLKRYVYLY